MYKVAHDLSYAETSSDHRYLIVKVFDNNNKEVSQIKFTTTNTAQVFIDVSGSGPVHFTRHDGSTIATAPI